MQILMLFPSSQDIASGFERPKIPGSAGPRPGSLRRAFYAAARLLGFLPQLDDLLQSLPNYPSTPEIRLPISESKKFTVIPKLKNKLKHYYILDIDGIRIQNESGGSTCRRQLDLVSGTRKRLHR